MRSIIANVNDCLARSAMNLGGLTPEKLIDKTVEAILRLPNIGYADLVEMVTAMGIAPSYSDSGMVLTEDQFVSVVIKAVSEALSSDCALTPFIVHTYGMILFDDSVRAYAYAHWMRLAQSMMSTVG